MTDHNAPVHRRLTCNLPVRARQAAALTILTAITAVTLSAADWMTAGNDAQRSFWVRTDPKISVQSFRKPGFGLVWKLKPENSARQLNSIMPGALLDFYIGYRGFRALGFFAASSNQVVAIDTELGRFEWQKDFGGGNASAAGSTTCPGGITAGATRPTTAAYPSTVGGRRSGRGTPAESGVGEPDQGAVTLARAEQRLAAPRPPVRRPAGAAAAANPFAPRVQWLMALSGDGYLHSMWVSNGHEPKPPVRFVPAGANAEGLIVLDNTAYVTTRNHCGGVDDGIWSLDLDKSVVNHWTPKGSDIAGTAGAAVGPDGTLYAATTGGELVALQPKTLKLLASQKIEGVKFTSSPVVFDLNGKNMVAASASDGRIYLFFGTLAGGAAAKSPVFSEPDFAVGSLSTWTDAKDTRWLLAPAGGSAAKAVAAGANGEIEHGAVVAWKIKPTPSGAEFEAGWASRDLTTPIVPVVENGVVFAVSSGEYRSTGAAASLSDIVKNSKPAVLYALDGETGKELWNSGTQITSFVHSGGLIGGETRLYLADYEGNEYAFGIPIEH